MSKFVKVEFKKVSSNIDLATYNRYRGILRVRFYGGRVYEYRNVTNSLIEAYSEAPSAGEYFSLHLRNSPDKYPVTRMDDDCKMLEEVEDSEDE